MSETWWVGEEELDDDQKNIIALPLTGNHLVTGPPGCGKTNLLLLRGNYMAYAAQPNIVIIVFTRTLQDFIIAGGNQYAFPVDRVKTSRKWAADLLYEYGETPNPPDDFDAQRKYFLDRVTELADKRKLRDIYDAILLDESQDYLPEEIELFARLAKSLFAVADVRQKIYSTRDPIPTLEGLVGPNKHCLKYHYRCGRQICRLADAIGKDSPSYVPLVPTSNYDEVGKPSSVQPLVTKSTKEQAAVIVSRLQVEMNAYPGELLGVVTPRNADVDVLWEEISQSAVGQFAILHKSGEHSAFDTSKQIVVGTCHAAKGLEFRTLHFACSEYLKRFQLQRNIAYTAVTRTKTSLSVYNAATIPGFLEKALASLDPAPDLPKIKDAFGKKK